MGYSKGIALLDQILASHNIKGQKPLVFSVTLFLPIKLEFAFLCKPHCSVTQCQPVSETCLSNSDNSEFQQHKCCSRASGLLKVIKLNCFPSSTFILSSG